MTEPIYAARVRTADTLSFPSAPPPSSPRARTSFLGALRRYPMIVLFFLVLLAAAGVTYGIKRPPVYKATTEMNVGTPNSDAQATPGYELAAEDLASSYSREVTSQVVSDVAGRTLHLSVAQTGARLSSSAVPSSPTFYIYATGPTPAAAITLANQATAVLKSKVNTGLQSAGATSLLVQYNRLQAQANQLSSSAGRLQAKYNQQASATTTSPSTDATTTSAVKITQAQVDAAKLHAQTAQLKAQTVAQRYTTAASNGPSANLVALFDARTATDDRTTVTERYGLVGAIAGIVIGAVLAFLLARWRDRRLATWV